MHKLIFLSLQILIYNIINLFLFSDPALSQKQEFEVQDCNINIEQDTYNEEWENYEADLYIFDGNCQSEQIINKNNTSYKFLFNLQENNPNSNVTIINQKTNQRYIYKHNPSQLIRTISFYFLKIYPGDQLSLVILYGGGGNGFNNCHNYDLRIVDDRIPNGYFRVKANEWLMNNIENADNNEYDQYYTGTCLKFKDIDKNGIIEITALDDRFSSQFGSNGAASSAPERVLQATQNELIDVTKKYPNFIKKQAGEAWNRVLSIKPNDLVAQDYYSGSKSERSASAGYFLSMANYLALKSLLGEYKEAMSLVNKRLEIDELNFFAEGQKFPYDVEEFLIERGYIKRSDGLMIYLPQNNKLTCQESIDSVKAELVKRQYFVNYKHPYFGLIKPKLTIEKDLIKQGYYDYPPNRTKAVVFHLSGNVDALSDFLSSRKLMESLTARILGSCQDFGLVEYLHWYDTYVPVGYFPDGSVRSFTWVDNSYIGDNPYTRSKDGYTQYKWGYYFSP